MNVLFDFFLNELFLGFQEDLKKNEKIFHIIFNCIALNCLNILFFRV